MPVMRLSVLLFVIVVTLTVDKGWCEVEITNGQPIEKIYLNHEGRSRFKGGILRKMALPLLLLMKLKAVVVIPVLFGIVSLVAFKGLWSGMTALFVSAAVALRGLIPPPKIIQLPAPNPHQAVVTDYYDYKRADDVSRVDNYRYGWR